MPKSMLFSVTLKNDEVYTSDLTVYPDDVYEDIRDYAEALSYIWKNFDDTTSHLGVSKNGEYINFPISEVARASLSVEDTDQEPTLSEKDIRDVYADYGRFKAYQELGHFPNL